MTVAARVGRTPSHGHDVLRILALDHFFDQDLRALESCLGVRVRRIPYQRLRRAAMRIIGKEVGTGLEAYNRPIYDEVRRRYAEWLRREVVRLYLEDAFDVFVVPSDTFFYVRALPQATHALGIPVVVVQKETTISVDTMESHSQAIGSQASFISDLMTVCSERHREFWLRAGADGSRIVVTGQPRFDVYAKVDEHPRREPPEVLFLTYELDAYVPGVGHGAGLRTWERLRTETERTLIELAATGSCKVLVKCHPQQNHAVEVNRVRAMSGSQWGTAVRVADPDADTRTLILESDAIVGFQTTALYEAVAAKKLTVYAAWGQEFESHRAGLVPFHASPAGSLHWARSPDELASLLTTPQPPPMPNSREWFEETLGPVDGRATERVVSLLTRLAEESMGTSARDALDARRHAFARALLLRAGTSELLWTAAGPVARLAGQTRRVEARRRAAGARRNLALRELRRPRGETDGDA
jgi:hypothetical protein